MALFSVFFRLALAIVPAVASSVVRHAGVDATGQVRNNRVGSGAWSQATAKSNSQVGLAFWRALRKELELKKKDLASNDVHESTSLSSAARRDLLWQAVREVDDKFNRKYMCAVEEGTTYAKEAMFLQGQAAYSKTNIVSARECALMCAADSLADRNHKDLACKSFAYNKTAQECKFFNFAHQEQKMMVKDACCTTGQPCNLDSMRDEIQTHFQLELKRTILKVPSHYVAPKVEPIAAPKVEPIAAPKVEQKTAPPMMQVAPKIEQKVAPQMKQVDPKVAPKVEQKIATHAPKVELSVPSHSTQVAPQVEQKAASQAKQLPPVAHVAPAASAVKHAPKHHRVHWRRWRRLIISTSVGVVLVSMLALAWRCRGTGMKGGSLNQLGA